MAAQKSSYLKTKAIKHILGIASFTMPTNVYLALFTGDPTAAGTGPEVSGGSYARKVLGSSFAAESGGSVATNADVVFSSMPTCSVTHWGLFDASTSGNLLYYGQFEVASALTSGDSFTIASGNATFSEE